MTMMTRIRPRMELKNTVKQLFDDYEEIYIVKAQLFPFQNLKTFNIMASKRLVGIGGYMPKISEEKLKAKRKHIIDCAFKIFSEKGYDATTMDDIVKLSGVSKGGIYHYFPSKEDVFFDIAEIQLSRRQALINEMSKTGTFKQFLETYIKTVIKALDDEDEIMNAKFSFEFWSIVTRAPKLQQYAQRRFAGFYKDLESLFKASVEKGELSNTLDITAVGYVLIATLDGIIHTHAVMGIKASDQVIDHYTKAMINIVTNK